MLRVWLTFVDISIWFSVPISRFPILESFKNKVKFDKIYFETDNFSDSNIKIKDFIIINKRFDNWVLLNKSVISNNVTLLKRIFIYLAAYIGNIFSIITLKVFNLYN